MRSERGLDLPVGYSKFSSDSVQDETVASTVWNAYQQDVVVFSELCSCYVTAMSYMRMVPVKINSLTTFEWGPIEEAVIIFSKNPWNTYDIINIVM